MKLVVDSNVLFTFFWEKSTSRELFLRQDLELFSPELAIHEIDKYAQDIMRKAKLSKSEFERTKGELKVLIGIIPLEEYSSFLERARHICPYPNDVDFVALALKLNCPVWSNDKELHGKVFRVWGTREVINLFD